MADVGIYTIYCTANDKFYVGQSTDIRHRWKQHIRSLGLNKAHNQHLQNAWNKHGSDTFEFNIVELCEIDSLDRTERFWMWLLKPKFNWSPVEPTNRGRKYSDESKLKMRLAKLGKKQTLEHRSNIRLGHLGYRHTKESILKMQVSQNYEVAVWKHRPVSDSTKLKLRNASLAYWARRHAERGN